MNLKFAELAKMKPGDSVLVNGKLVVLTLQDIRALRMISAVTEEAPDIKAGEMYYLNTLCGWWVNEALQCRPHHEEAVEATL